MKRNFRFGIAMLVIGCAAIMTACQKTPPAPELTVSSPSSIELSVGGDSGSITFTTNQDWTASASEAWLHISPSYGSASDAAVTVSVSCDANTTYEDRTATVTIRAGELVKTISVTQPANLGLIINGDPVREVTAEEESLELEVKANVSYAVTIDVDWIVQVGTKGLVTDKLVFSIKKNDTYDSREGKILLSGGGLAQEVIVTQNAKTREYVEMGDGLKWAIMNLGANKPEEYGDYYAWGETASKEDYSWSTYKWMQEGQSDWKYITRYTIEDKQTDGIWYDSDGNFIGDGKSSLADYDYIDDPARELWGETWRTPTFDELIWLGQYCKWTRTEDYQGSGVAGWIVTSKVSGYEDNSIFLPAAGCQEGTSLERAGSFGFYRSSSLNSSPSASYLYFTEIGIYGSGSPRCYGYSVRPVSE